MTRHRLLPCIAVTVVAICSASTAFAQVPDALPVQGKLVDANGPVTDSVTMDFVLRDDTGATLYTYPAQSVMVTDGAFSLLLTPGNDFDPLVFATALPTELAVTIDGTGEPLVYELGSVPYAFYSQHAVTADAAGSVAWSGVQSVPTDLTDGDDDTTYTAGSGLSLTSGEFTLDTTFGDARYVNEGQANSVTSAMITDGTITQSDVAGAAGRFLNRSAMYVIKAQDTVAPGSVAETAAACNDTNDIPIAGGCRNLNPNIYVVTTHPENWEPSSGLAAAWRCQYLNPTSGTYDFEAQVVCLTVP